MYSPVTLLSEHLAKLFDSSFVFCERNRIGCATVNIFLQQHFLFEDLLIVGTEATIRSPSLKCMVVFSVKKS